MPQLKLNALLFLCLTATALLRAPAHALSVAYTRTAVSVGDDCARLFRGGNQIRLISGKIRCSASVAAPIESGFASDIWIKISWQVVHSARTPSTAKKRIFRKTRLPQGKDATFSFILNGKNQRARYTIRAFAIPVVRIDDPALSICDQVFNEFVNESVAIRSCTSDAECGQQLTGTSCGCTRDMIARKNADPTTFYQILTRAETLGCSASLPIASACDCPQTDGARCNNGICDWNMAPAIS